MDMQLKGLVIVALLMPIVVAADYHFRVANAQITFALTPSPNQKVLFILAGRGGDNEVPSGVPTVVDLDLATSKTLNGQETFWFDSNAVWSKDGRRLWAETASGIYEITLSEHLDQTARRIISGKTRGLAISEEHRRLAYWTIAPHSCTLTVVDLTTKLKVREWKLPFLYDGEPSGFELTFQGDLLYARTFDIEGRTPLKVFDLRTGLIHEVTADCIGLAATSDAVYFITETRGLHALKRMADSQTITLSSPLSYADVRATADPGRLALADPSHGRSAIWDTSANQIVGASKCSAVTVLADGTPIYGGKGVLSSSPSICK